MNFSLCSYFCIPMLNFYFFFFFTWYASAQASATVSHCHKPRIDCSFGFGPTGRSIIVSTVGSGLWSIFFLVCVQSSGGLIRLLADRLIQQSKLHKLEMSINKQQIHVHENKIIITIIKMKIKKKKGKIVKKKFVCNRLRLDYR